MIFEELKEILKEFDFTVKDHQPTYTSEESAAARGEELKIGGKALVIKVDQTFKIFVLSGNRSVNNKQLKNYFESKKLRFASKEELLELTGLPPGAVPPFGKPLFNLELYVDSSILENEYIAFNAGSLVKSIKMKVKDYLKAANPIVFSFSVDNN